MMCVCVLGCVFVFFCGVGGREGFVSGSGLWALICWQVVFACLFALE